MNTKTFQEQAKILANLIGTILSRNAYHNSQWPAAVAGYQLRPISFDAGDAEHYMVIGLHDISQLKAVDQMKSDFVTMVSHELRAPLTTVAASAETLGLLDPAADHETYYEVLNLLDQQTRRLRQVVEEVLQSL